MINPKEIDDLMKRYLLKIFNDNLKINVTHTIRKPLRQCLLTFEYQGKEERMVVDYAEERMGEFKTKIKTTAPDSFYHSIIDIIFGTFNINIFERVNETANLISNISKNYKIFDKIDITNDHFIGLKKKKDKDDGYYYTYAVNSNIVNCTLNDRLYPFLQSKHNFFVKTQLFFKKDKIYPISEIICSTMRESNAHLYLYSILFDIDSKYSSDLQTFKSRLNKNFKAQLFTHICKEYNISMKDLMNMTEDEILPYALVVQMLIY